MTPTQPDADDILTFWFDEAGPKKWYNASPAFDAVVRRRFHAAVEREAALLGQGRHPWQDSAEGALALIVLLDQFPRNIYRGTARAFGYDRMALGLAKDGLLSHVDEELTEVEQVFFYLPLEHSERVADQALCVQLMEKLVKTARPEFRSFAENTLDYAHKHKAVIDQFGRFPHRNAALGRTNTPEEDAYLAQPGAGF